MKIGTQTQASFSSAIKNFKSSGFLLRMTLGFVLLAKVTMLPTGITAWFDGLPWTGPVETLIIFILLPFLVILDHRFLSFRWPLIFLFVLLIIKVGMFVSAPASGWLVKVYPEMTLEEVKQNNWHKEMFEAVTSGNWIETYATSWNNNASGLLKTPWVDKKQFPLDWFLPYSPASKNEFEQFDALSPWIEFKGSSFLPQKSSLVIVAQGVISGALEATGPAGEKFSLPLAKDYREARELALGTPKGGNWLISGKLQFRGTDWSFVPVLIDTDGAVSSDLGRLVLWQNRSALSVPFGTLLFYKSLSWIIDIGICIFFVAWLVWAVYVLVQKQILSLPLFICSAIAIFIPITMDSFFDHVIGLLNDLRNLILGPNFLPLNDLSKISYLGFSVIIVSAGFIFWIYWRNDYRNFQSDRIGPTVFLLYGPAIFVFFSIKWFPQIGHWSLWSPGDDWTSYQLFARKIVVDGEWLNAGEGVFVLQPLYRYFVGLYHWLFGQSAFVQRMADVWCILGATYLLVNWIITLRMMAIIAFLASVMYLMINLIGTFRMRIGEGLAENHAMIFMMLAACFLYQARIGSRYRIMLATFFGIFGYWTRQDHLGAIAGLAFLLIEPMDGKTGYWKDYWNRFKLLWGRIACYWAGGIISVFLICIRNWWLGGDFYPTNIGHPNLRESFENYSHIGGFYLILAGKPWPAFPQIAGFTMTIGTFIGLLALAWRPKILSNFPLSLGITIVGLLAPYSFLLIWNYHPRFSIHLLPLAILALMYLLNNIFNSYYLPSRLGWQGK